MGRCAGWGQDLLGSTVPFLIRTGAVLSAGLGGTAGALSDSWLCPSTFSCILAMSSWAGRASLGLTPICLVSFCDKGTMFPSTSQQLLWPYVLPYTCACALCPAAPRSEARQDSLGHVANLYRGHKPNDGASWLGEMICTSGWVSGVPAIYLLPEALGPPETLGQTWPRNSKLDAPITRHFPVVFSGGAQC